MDDVDAKTKFNIMNDFDMIEIPYQIDLVFVIDVQKKEFLNSIEIIASFFIKRASNSHPIL